MNELTAKKLIEVLTSLPNLEVAQDLGRHLIYDGLAACVQMQEGLYSIYRWEGKVCEDREVLFSAKTTIDLWPKIHEYIQKNHPYDLPEIIAITPSEYDQAYGKWVNLEVQNRGQGKK